MIRPARLIRPGCERLGVCLGLFLLFATSALSEEQQTAQGLTFNGAYPKIFGGLQVELRDDWTVKSDDPNQEVNEFFTPIEGAVGVDFTSFLFLRSLLAFDRTNFEVTGEDRYVEDHGLYVKRLYLAYEGRQLFSENDTVAVFGGKRHADFGTAWYQTPGIYGSDFAGSYEIVERIILGGSVEAGNFAVGLHRLSASTFFADTSALSERHFTGVDRLRRSDGGPSNTEDFSSFAVALDGREIPGFRGFSYHLGYQNQAAGDNDADDQQGVVGGLRWAGPATEAVYMEALGEVAQIWNVEQTLDDSLIATVGAAAYYNRWFVTGAVAMRNRDAEDPETGSDLEDRMATMSVGYEILDNVGIEVGYRFLDEDNIDSHTVGLRIFALVGAFCQLTAAQQLCE